MHSPRLQQVRKKADLSPRVNAPLKPVTDLHPKQHAGVDSTMTSASIDGLVDKYNLIHGVDLSVVEGLLESSTPKSAQEVARIAMAIAPPKKPDAAKQEDPFQGVGSRVYDFLKKPALGQSALVHNQPTTGARLMPLEQPAPHALTTDAVPSRSTGAPQYVALSARLPSLPNKRPQAPPVLQSYALPMPPAQQGPLVRHAPAAFGHTGGAAARLTSPDRSTPQKHSPTAPAAQSSATLVAVASKPTQFQGDFSTDTGAPFVASNDHKGLSLVPTAGYHLSGGLAIVQSPHAPPPPASHGVVDASRNSNAALLQQIEEASSSVVGDDAIEIPTASSGAVSAAEADRLNEARRQRLSELLLSKDIPPPPLEATGSSGRGAAAPPSSSKSKIEIAKLRNKIALLCQQVMTLMAQELASSDGGEMATTDELGNSIIEALVLERGDVVWRSTFEDIKGLLTTTTVGGDGGAGSFNADPLEAEENWLLSDDVDGAVDDSLTAVKARARKAYGKAMAGYKAKLAQQRDLIAQLKGQITATQPGGSRYQQLEEDLKIVRDECRKQMTKIKTLVNLLDRAGQTIRFHEDQRHAEAVGSVMRKENAAPWSYVRRLMPSLDVEPPRTDAQILQDIIKFMEKQDESITDYSNQVEQLTTQLEEVQGAHAAVVKANKTLQRELDQTKYELETMRQRRKYEQEERSAQLAVEAVGNGAASGAATHAGGRRQSLSSTTSDGGAANAHDSDKMRLVEKIATLESALKASTEARGMFQSLGMAATVLPFLRTDAPQVRNICLSKAAVENLICGIWLTRFLPSIAQSRPVVDCHWIAKEAGTAIDFSRGSSVVKSLERMFILAVQATLGATSGGDGVESSSVVTQSSSSMAASPSGSAGEVSTPVTLNGPQLASDRHPACDFTDDNNILFWQVKRSEAKRMVSFIDHITRFVLECVEPSACRTCLSLYTVNSGITTPPISALQWQKKCDLFLQAPQFASLSRPGVPLPTNVVEVTYSLMDGCEKFSFDGDVAMFKRIVQGEIPEAAYFDMMLMIEKLRLALLNSHTLYAPPYRWPAPTVATVLHVLKRFFPKKSIKALAHLQRCLLLDVKETTINSDNTTVMRMMRRASAVVLLGEGAVEAEQRHLAAHGTAGQQQAAGTPPPSAALDIPIDLASEDSSSSSADHTHHQITQEALRSPVDVARLFSATESGNQGHFLDALKSQYIAELLRYTHEVRMCILAAGEEAAASATAMPTGISMIDDVQLSTIEKSKKRRASVSQYFQQQSQADSGLYALSAVSAKLAPLRLVADRLFNMDPTKAMGDVETYVYHLLQIYLMSKATRAGGMTPTEMEWSTLSKEEMWKRQTRNNSFNVPVGELVTYCSMVLFRRSGVDFATEEC